MKLVAISLGALVALFLLREVWRFIRAYRHGWRVVQRRARIIKARPKVKRRPKVLAMTAKRHRR